MNTEMKLFWKVVTVAFLCFISTTAFGQREIKDEAGLRAIANDLTGEYILAADITLTDTWTPIGDDENRFAGKIDGNGKAIYGLKFKNSSKDCAGFIGIADGATIENLSLVGVEIYGGQDVGAVIGRSYGSTIEKCYTSGVVSGYDHIGGIIGGTKSGSSGYPGSISNCFSTAAIVSTSWQAGGIIGASIDTDVSNSYFAGVAVCPSGGSAGIVAVLDGIATTINNSVVMSPYLKGDTVNSVLADPNKCEYSLSNNYSWEDTKVYRKNILFEERINSAEGTDGGHVSTAQLKSVAFYVEQLMWDVDIWKMVDGKYPIFSHQEYPLKGDAIYIPIFPDRPLPGTTFSAAPISALGRTVTCVSSNPDAVTIDENGLVTFMKDGATTLTFTTQGDDYSEGATVTVDLTVKGISYTIRTEEDLRNIKFDLAGIFTLENDITLTKNWELLGTFKGTLNGNGKVIYGLKYSNKDQNQVGLFGQAEGAIITKLGIKNANIVGNQNVGAIVGKALGCIISECYVDDSYIAGRDHIGAIVGEINSYNTEEGEETITHLTTVSNCHSGAHIYSREFQAGGIAGTICAGTLEKCYFSGVAQAKQGRAAGIVSLVDGNGQITVENNINLSVGIYCSEKTFRVGEKGTRENASFSNNWSAINSYLGATVDGSATMDNESNADGENGCNVNDNDDARSQSFYTGTLGWDFENTWKFITNTEGKMYPVLKWQEAPLTSAVYGIPEPAYLVWTPAATAAINLERIMSSCGQKLNFEVTEGHDLVDMDGDFLYVATEVSQSGVAKVRMSNNDKSLDNVIHTTNTEFSVDVILSDETILISTPQEFIDINNKLFAKFRLTANIDLTGIEFYGIGSGDTPFTGSLDGNKFAILNPVVITEGDNTKGLFNATNNAKISNLGVYNFSFSGSATTGDKSVDLGGLVGSCKNTTISNCYLTGTVIGRDHVGGFVGGNCEGVTITDSYVDAEIIGGSQVGGFFGVTAGDNIVIKNSYFAGSVKATSRAWAAGFIGLIDRPGTIEISNCVSIGDAASVDAAGAFIGGNGGDLTNPHATIKFTNNRCNANAIITTNGNQWTNQTLAGGTVEEPITKVISELKQKETYTDLGWDFEKTWVIGGDKYPELIGMPVPPDPTGIFTQTNDVNNYIVSASDDKISVSGIEESAKVTVYNVNGQTISQASVTGSSVVLPVSAKGFYIVRITENEKTTSVKVINK